MADGDNVFVYLGGEQEVPDGVTHAIIDPSVKNVRRRAFYNRQRLVSVIFHDGVEIIEQSAFNGCCMDLRFIKLLGVREIGHNAFQYCTAVSDVQFSDRLETIGEYAFDSCCLRSIKMPSVRIVQRSAFIYCRQLTDVEFGINLETIGVNTFYNCRKLQRISIPLKDNLFPIDPYDQRYTQFHECRNLTTVDIVGAEEIKKTISSMLLKSWRDEMNEEIDRINRELRGTFADRKTNAIRLWIRSVIHKLDHYKAEHNRLLKEGMTLLELAVWKAKLYEKEDRSIEEGSAKKAKIDTTIIRKEHRITSGADIVIRSVVPFLQLDE